ncbi:MAG: hypothetical protein R3F21_09440 [Myxococcota bacterium]
MAVVVSSAVTLILVVALVGWMLKFAGTTQPAPPDQRPSSADEMKAHVLWGLFYANPADPRGWVQKSSGFGYTVNFRTERNAKIFAGLIVATAVSAGVQILVSIYGC